MKQTMPKGSRHGLAEVQHFLAKILPSARVREQQGSALCRQRDGGQVQPRAWITKEMHEDESGPSSSQEVSLQAGIQVTRCHGQVQLRLVAPLRLVCDLRVLAALRKLLTDEGRAY